MRRETRRTAAVALGLIAALAVPGATVAQVVKAEGSALDAVAFTSDRLRPTPALEPLADLQGLVPAEVSEGWASFQLDAGGTWQAWVDRRTGRLELAEGSGIPWVPGAGNQLTLGDVEPYLADAGEPDLATLEAIARDLLPEVAPLLGVDPGGLRLAESRSGRVADYLWYVDFDLFAGELPVEGARVVFRVNNGNLVQFGGENLPVPGAAAPAVKLTRDEAMDALDAFAGGLLPTDVWIDRGSLRLLPVAVNDPLYAEGFAFGEGRGLIAVWQLTFRRPGLGGTWRGRVDATTGEVLELIDVNDYGRVHGGVFLNSPPVETVMPMPWADYSAACSAPYADSAGVFPDGAGTASTLCGQYVRIADNCGAISQAVGGDGDIDFGTSGGTDCTTPGHGGAGNTHSARTQFYHLNRAKEAARGWLSSSWLSQRLTANVNINLTCNAFWNGSTVNFYRAGGGCGNTGEIAGVSLHEYGHGLDSNDGNGSSADKGTGETYGDFTAALSLHDSCVGSTFWSHNCTGYGDACTSCSGIRDIDYARHASGAPHTVANFTQPLCPTHPFYRGPCGREGHCESYVSSEALWDLAARDLPYAGGGRAWNVVERLWYLSRPTATKGFICNTGTSPWSSHGCGTGTYWRTLRAVDDDDGNLANGTPNSCYLYAAFNRHLIACTSDAGAATCYRGCTPPSIPYLTVTAGYEQVDLSWTSSGVGVVYDVFRNEVGCGAGFVKIADDVTGTTYTDTEAAGGQTFYYQVVAQPAGNEACSSYASTCRSVELPSYYTCTVDVAGGTHDCDDGIVTVTASSGNQRVVEIDMSGGWQRLDAMADVCSPSGWVLHFSDSPSCNGWGGDSADSTHDAEVHLKDTGFDFWGTYDYGRGVLEPVFRRLGVLPASGCTTTQWSLWEDRAVFDADGDPANSSLVSIDAASGFDLPPYDEPDSEDPGGLYEDLWYAGINRTVGASYRYGYGADRVCFVLSTTTNPSAAALSSLCGS